MSWGYLDMGLLKLIEGRALDKPRGLLARSVKLLQESGGDFSSVCVALGARHAALLINRSGVFRAVHAYMLDAPTFVTSVSSAAWWSGTLGAENERIFHRDDGTLSACYQLLSDAFRGKVTDLAAVPIESDAVFLCLMMEDEDIGALCTAETIKHAMKPLIKKADDTEELSRDDMASRFDVALKTGAAVLFRLDVSASVEENLKGLEQKDLTGGVKCDIREALYGEFLQIMRGAFPAPSYCSDSKDGTIKMVLFVDNGFDKDLALLHIQKRLESVLGKEADKVRILDESKTSNASEIISFVC